MREFWHRFLTNRYWFVGTIIVFLVLFFFFWHVIDPEGYANEINSWLRGLKEIFNFFLIIAIMTFGIAIIFRRTFRRGGGHH